MITQEVHKNHIPSHIYIYIRVYITLKGNHTQSNQPHNTIHTYTNDTILCM